VTGTNPRDRRLRIPGVERDLIGGRYRLAEVIGTGGMGRVWHGYDELLHRDVAVKEIGTPDDVTTSQMLDLQFSTMREARAAARLDQPGIVGVFDVIWRPGRSWIVMEYVPSRSLHQAIREGGPFSHRDAARVGLGVLSALRAAHAGGVLHRDVKPHNVLLAANGRVVLTDFGLAAVEGVHAGPDPLVGSPHYVAPERLSGGTVGAPADLWSLGATLYAAVVGRAPFQRGNTTASLSALMYEPPDPPDRPGPLDPVIAGLLAKDPAERPSAEQTERMLRRVADAPRTPAGSSPVPTVFSSASGTPPSRSRTARTTRIVLGIAAVLLVGSVGTALVADRTPAPPVRATLAAPSPSAAAPDGCAPGTATGGSAITRSTTTQPYALPAGWLWYGDRTGLAVAVPRGWLRTMAGPRTCFRDPGAGRVLSVDTAAPLTRSPVGYWEQAELAELGTGSLHDYRAIGMAALPLRSGGAAWEYTWQPASGPRLHERRTWIAMGGGRAYVVT
jgi:eukaryotic-like serine/threonine-protein kinase